MKDKLMVELQDMIVEKITYHLESRNILTTDNVQDIKQDVIDAIKQKRTKKVID